MMRKKLTEEGYAPRLPVVNVSRVEAIVDRDGIKPPRTMRSAALSWTQSSGGSLPKAFGTRAIALRLSVDGKSGKMV